MTKEQLIAMGLTEEQATKIMTSLDGNFVTKARFDEVNNAKKQLEKDIASRDEQLETLKNSTGDVESMREQISKLQSQNATEKANYEAQLKQIKLDNAVEKALIKAKAKNIKAVKALLDLENAELDGETVKGLDDQLKKLQEGDDSFLFEVQQQPTSTPKFKGFKPGESGAGKVDVGTQPSSLAEAVQMHFTSNE
ncbi:phage scaffolding protein [Paenibacillus lentus]|uniref:Phage minor structural protein GP20 n=1 Tax=Paenibacillus lentus TaxID=1338368 RepID=A0A3Q8S8J6_9BACL|nr:phage scaffolding protein [Paenibacillus lentus]AZK44782.1 hypothetical protein EIM92_00040 [Paenibacillus lentus]